MGLPDQPRRLVVNADDFGRSAAINEAIIRAHREGILTSASLMVNEPAFEQAVTMARENPRLGVGLHLTLLCGHSCLPAQRIPGLVNLNREFSDDPIRAGFRYYRRKDLREQLRQEIQAQFGKFKETGLPLDHVNGHLHMHMHPVVFGILIENAEKFGIQRMRLTRDPFWLNARLAGGQWWYRINHAIVYRWLAARARPALLRLGIKHTSVVYGLLQNARVDEEYITRLLPNIPAGNSELYSHPSLDEFKPEFDALVSPQVKEMIGNLGIELIRYQDL